MNFVFIHVIFVIFKLHIGSVVPDRGLAIAKTTSAPPHTAYKTALLDTIYVQRQLEMLEMSHCITSTRAVQNFLI
jgi:hypothetical protein